MNRRSGCVLGMVMALMVCGVHGSRAAEPKAVNAPVTPPPPSILAANLGGALARVEEIVFATRTPGTDPHWYANFGYWSEDAQKMMYVPGGRLCKLNLRTKQVTALVDDGQGSIRDPQVHYEGKKILFSYRKGESKYFNLYEINIDGTGLRQITSGPFDDIEPTYLPNGDIVFCSSRCKRWVNCWYTQVAIMYRCDASGGNLRPVSGNTEHDNTPAVMPDGRLLYTRWEYVDRSQVEFHHLWVANPDGTSPMTWFGNLHPGIVMIDSKAIPGTGKVLSIFSPGHGVNEHRGTLTVVTPDLGPDERGGAETVKGCPPMVRDPYPLSETLFLVARKNEILLVDAKGQRFEVIYADRQEVHEPNPIVARNREAVIPDRVKLNESTGRLILADAHLGRNMEGVRPGEIKKLLVLESLPKPVNFSGGPGPLTYLGTFTLERVVGTVPVEADGSAFIELPANRQFFFVALDEKDLSVKRMQSWVSVMPGETTSCAGCHEQRTQVAPNRTKLLAMRRPASRIEPFAGLPEVIDYPRDIQPVLDQHCVKCHSYEKPDGGIILSGDRGPQFSHSYWMLIASNQVADGRNGYGNRSPRTIGSSASELMKKIDGGHYGAKVTPRQWRLIWMWIESGATYSGTYASLGSGMVHVPVFEEDEAGKRSASGAVAALWEQRCATCHVMPGDGQTAQGKVPLPAARHARKPGEAAYERNFVDHDPAIRRSTQALYNLTRPERSILLLAPLAKEAGGWGACRKLNADGTMGEAAVVFGDTKDADYQKLLGIIRRTSRQLEQIKRFDMPGFQPNEQYVREMKRYGILAGALDPMKAPIDVYETDRRYWESLWWTGDGGGR